MTEEAIKQRINRAVKAAIKMLGKPPGHGHIIEIKNSNSPFHIEYIREKEIRKIRITVDQITDEDIKIMKEFKLPINCTKEIWCKKANERDFEYMEVI